MLRVIVLDTALTFEKALQYLVDGKCLGIRPGQNTRYVIPYKPGWMKSGSDFMLRWSGDRDDESPNTQIRSNQFLEEWYPVVVDHRFTKFEELNGDALK